VLVAAFPATPDWSNLPLKPEFVPLLLRAVAHVRRAAAAETIAAIQPFDPAPVRVTDRWPDAQVEAIDPAGKSTSIKLARSGRQRIGALTATDRKGYYKFVVRPKVSGALVAAAAAPGAGGGATPDKIELGFAVNLDASGTDFASLSEGQLRDTLAPAPLVYLRGTSEDPVLSRQLTQKREIWRTLIWLMFAVIGVEFLLATLRPARLEAERLKEIGPVKRFARSVNAVLTGGATE
jgi:hypothetical protein